MSTSAGTLADGRMQASMAMMSPAPGDSDATRDYRMAMMGMIQSMPAYSGNADVDFMKLMRVHHQAAIAMARVELARGQNDQAKALAQQIISAQQREIGTIDTWLAGNGG